MNPFFMTNIKVDKVRHLKNINIALSTTERKHLILTGKNGSGKTSLLEALRDFFVAHENGPFSSFHQSATHNHHVALEFNTLNYPDNVILVFFAAKRGISMEIPLGAKKIKLKDKYHIDSDVETPSLMFLQYLLNLKVEQSFARDDNESHVVEKIEQWFNRFEETLQKLFEDETLKLQFDRKNYNFYLKVQGKELFDLNSLSDGYSAVFKILSDLILRMENTNSYDMQGIVLIDEIETHLHVELQKKILPFLSHFFPNIQFIVSTHSPFVLTSLEEAIIYDLEHQLRIEDLSPYSYDAVVEKYFAVDKYSILIKDKVKEYEYLLNKEKKTPEEQFKWLSLKNYLKKVPPDFAPELVAHFQSLELQEMI